MTDTHTRISAALATLGWSTQRWAREIGRDPSLVRRWRNPKHSEHWEVPDEVLADLERWALDGK